MRIPTLLIVSLFALPLISAACGHSHDGYETLQDCYDEHVDDEGLPVVEAIAVCCLDHPIEGVNPSCGDTEEECFDHVDLELDPSVTEDEIDAACADYIDNL
jgi:hypothetical protein